MFLSNKKGELSFEAILTTAFVLVILVVVGVSSLFFYNREHSDRNNSGITNAYNKILAQIRVDCQRAKSVVTSDISFILSDKNSKLISKYEIKDKNFIRIDDKNKPLVLIYDVESAYFGTRADLPNLLTIRIFPADKKAMPFFTSFALRGANGD